MKKLNSFILGVLLITSALVVFAPVMPAKALFMPEFFVSPAKNKFYAPCIVSTEFDISVKIFNQKEETGKEIYAFDFWLYWLNSTYGWSPQGDLKQSMITLEKIEVKPPWPEGQYFIIANETNFNTKTGKWEGEFKSTLTFTDPWGVFTHFDNNYWNYYHLAITALDTAPPLIDVKIPVVDLTFHIDDEPIYGTTPWDSWMTPFALKDTKMSSIDPITNKPVPVDHWIEDGGYKIEPEPPKIGLTAEKSLDKNANGVIDFYYIVRWIKSEWFTVGVEVADVGKMYSFNFTILFNATLLNTDLQHVHVKDFLPPPYSVLNIEVYEPPDPWATPGYVKVVAERPCEKPPVCGSGEIVNIDFHTKCPTAPGWTYILPQTVSSEIKFDYAIIDSKYFACGTYHQVDYNYPAGNLELTTEENHVMYHFIPKVQDLDQSGHVDLIDLGAIAKQYGKPLSGNAYATAFTQLAASTTAPVDLYDVVMVAKYFCKPYTPKDPYTDLPYDP